MALSTNTPVQEKLWRDAAALSYHMREVGPTCGLPSAITYDEATVDHIWKIRKIREDCIGDPISMAVNAHK
jgi:hypothetical protein